MLKLYANKKNHYFPELAASVSSVRRSLGRSIGGSLLARQPDELLASLRVERLKWKLQQPHASRQLVRPPAPKLLVLVTRRCVFHKPLNPNFASQGQQPLLGDALSTERVHEVS